MRKGEKALSEPFLETGGEVRRVRKGLKHKNGLENGLQRFVRC